jgi:cytokinesis protein
MVKAEAQRTWEEARRAEKRKEEEVRSGKKRSGAIKNSPEWFLRKLMDGSVTAQHIQMLHVAMRTSPLE